MVGRRVQSSEFRIQSFLCGLFLLLTSELCALNSTQLPVFYKLPPFTLTDQNNAKVSLADIKEPWIADFIFTRCSSQCPMVTQRVRKAAERLPGMRFVSFSLDPKDTPQALKEYSERHKADWTFLTGKRGQVRKLSLEGFKLAVVDGNPDGTISHSQYLVLVDAQGGVRGYYDATDKVRLEALVRDADALRQPRP